MHLVVCVSVACLRELRGFCLRGYRSDPVNRYLPISNFELPVNGPLGVGGWALIVALTLSLFGSIVTAQSLPVSARAFAITHYDVELRPHLDARTVDGLVSLTVQVPDAGTSNVTLNRGALEIDEVMEGGRPLTFQIDSALLQSNYRPATIGAHARSQSDTTAGPRQGWCLHRSGSSSTRYFPRLNGCLPLTIPARAPPSVFVCMFPDPGREQPVGVRSPGARCRPASTSWNGCRNGRCRRTHSGSPLAGSQR